MKLKELAVKPQLVKMTITNEAIVKKYGEELEFYVYDRQPLDIFTKMADITGENTGEYIHVLKDIILDEAGEPVCKEDMVLPIDVLTEAIKLIGEHLGK